MPDDVPVDSRDSESTGFEMIDRCLAWWRKPLPLDPWDRAITDSLNQPDAVEVCHHCFAPQVHCVWFCPSCGRAVGPYNNYMPYVHIFSTWEVLLSGLDERAHFNKLTIPGYVLAGFGQLFVFAPLYWVRVFLNLHRQRQVGGIIPPTF